MAKDLAMVYNIQRFSVYDGPGARTVVFFKGCNLRCLWCHNPESIAPFRQLMFNPANCIGCGQCFVRCRNQAHTMHIGGAHVLNRGQCQSCFSCADGCFAQALTVAGREIDPEALLAEIETDLPYFQRLGGGVTFSGGECMLQAGVLEEILCRCKQLGIHTAVDTAGNVPWGSFERILNTTDLFLYDIKAADPLVHKRLTGVTNRLILDNLVKLLSRGKDIQIRVPFVPGANAEEMEGIAKLLITLGIREIALLAYHTLGISKTDLLGERAKEFDIPAQAALDQAIHVFDSYRISVIKS